MDFREADRRYTDLKQQYDNGDLSDDEYRTQLEQIAVQDAEGRWWVKHRETGAWYYQDGDTWVQGTPPIDDRNGRDNGKSGSDEALERSSAARGKSGSDEALERSSTARVILWVLTISCAVFVIFPFARGPCPGYFTVFFVVLAVIFGYLARR